MQSREYPWNQLQHYSWEGVHAERAARAAIASVVDLGLLERVARELFACELEAVGTQGGWLGQSARALGANVELSAADVAISFSVQSSLVTMLLARLLGRTVQLEQPTQLTDTLLGAWHAMVDEVARRVAVREPLEVSAATGMGAAWCVDFWVRLDGITYCGCAAIRSSRRDQPASTLSNSALPLTLELVLANALASRSDLAALALGDAFVPERWMVDATLCGEGVLCSRVSENGLRVKLEKDELRVLGPSSLLFEGESMTDQDNTTHDAVADAPVLVRVEVGTVTMSARDWVALAPGDVIGTGNPLLSPVTLRVAGQKVAEGELVNISGELGVRITKLT